LTDEGKKPGGDAVSAEQVVPTGAAAPDEPTSSARAPDEPTLSERTPARTAMSARAPDEPTMPATAPISAEVNALNFQAGIEIKAALSAAPAPTATDSIPPRGGVPYGRYQLLRKIATGGMAQLYLATMSGEANFQKLCVVKKILPHLAEQSHFVDMFLDEARIAATLDHPNIVHIFDLGKVGSSYFIAMEYIAGEDLSHLQKRAVREGHELHIELCCRLVADLCAGLHYAHEQKGLDGTPLNIVHRDVSPQNVLITYSGQVKIVDFGIAKAANKASHTRTGTIMGKSAYMSPEQCLGEPLDRRSDVFAVGILLFELLTGRRLFKRETELLTLRAITEEPIPDINEYRHSLPANLVEIVNRALRQDREERFATVLEMREALERFIAGFGVPATSMELASLLEDLFPDHVERQSRVREAGSISEVIAALPSTGIKDLGTPSAQRSHTMTDVVDRSLKGWLVWAGLGISALIAVVAVTLLFMQPPPEGELVLATTPNGAAVRLDDQLLGTTPLALEDLKLDHPYQLLVSASGFTPHRQNLLLTVERPSQQLSLVLEALPAPSLGSVVVTTEPAGARVLLDGKETGKLTPAHLEGLAADLEHQIGVQLEGYQPDTRRVLLRPGAEQEITLTLAKLEPKPDPRPRPGTGRRPGGKPGDQPDVKPPVETTSPPVETGTGYLTLRTSPWTRVFQGKVDLGDSPLFKIELPVGKVKLRLVNKEKGIDERVEVTIKKDEVTTVDKKL